MDPQRHQSTSRSHPNSGHAVVEAALMAPWIFFIFIATLDFGFYAYWLMAVTNASRAAALATYQNGASPQIACSQVLNELRGVLGRDAATNCSGSDGSPLLVTLRTFPDAGPLAADGTESIVVTVEWETTPLIWVPGMANQFTIRRDTEVRTP